MKSKKILLLLLFVIMSFLSAINFHSASHNASASPSLYNDESQLLPFVMGSMLNTSENDTGAESPNSSNSSNSVIEEDAGQTEECNMPPCPPGEVCMQVCP